jgi:hypothetical protein
LRRDLCDAFKAEGGMYSGEISGGGSVGSGGGYNCCVGETGDAREEWNEDVDEEGDKGVVVSMVIRFSPDYHIPIG